MNKKNIIITILIVIIVILIGIIFFIKNNESKNTTTKINNKNNQNNNELEIKEDKKEINNESKKTETTKTNNESKKTETKTNNESKVTETSKINTKSKDDNVIEEFLKIEQEVNNNIYDKSSTFLDKIGDKVATMIGFIWYGEEINGVTYNELSSSAKTKVKNIYYNVDSKIENKIPNYKEKIKYKYSVIKNFIKDKYDDLKYNVDSWLLNTLGSEKYSEFKKAKEELKEGTSNSINDMKIVKDLYKEKIYEWYQKKKS